MAALKREINPMPDDIKQLLLEADLMELYNRRPPYQRNDYIAWINRAKLPATRGKRINQMLDELKTGEKYMGMNYHAR